MPRSTVAHQTAERERLEARDWLQAAVEVMSDDGIEAVRVEPLARRLGVTKGSFYWHFTGRGALLDALVTEWRQRSTLAIIARLEGGSSDPRTRLEQLLRIPFGSERALRATRVELSIRQWGKRDARVGTAIKDVDELRLRFMERLYTDMGLGPDEAAVRSTLAYSFFRLGNTLIEMKDKTKIDNCIQALMAAPN